MIRKPFTYLILFYLVLNIIVFTPELSQASDEVITWKMQVAYPLHADAVGPVLTWAKEMEKLTKGRLIIKPFAPGSLCPTTEIVNFVEKGAIDCAMSYGAYYTGSIPEANIATNVPMGCQTIGEVWDAWYNRGLLDIIREAYAERKIHYCFYPVQPWYSYITQKPIRTLKDLEGLKIRAVGTFGRYTQLLGASPVSIPGAELYMALKLGTIDGALYSSTGMKDNKLYETVKYRMYPTSNIVVADLFIGQKSIEKLPEDLRFILLNTTDDILFRGGLKLQVQDKMAQLWLDKESERTYLPENDVKKATEIAQKVWDEIATKNDRCRKGIEILKQQLRDIGRLSD